ncbi:MAG: OmpH/Skp family outer membrane protein [Planctomycetota bacterium]|jgi:Skp family chaperone for outer membrane proteins
MKIKTAFLGFLTGVVVLAVGYDYSRAESTDRKSSLKIGVVSIRKIFGNSKGSKEHADEIRLEENKVNAELRTLEKKIEAAEAGLEMLKRESKGYLASQRDVAQKRADYRNQKLFYENLLELNDRQWLKAFYKDILRITSEVAREKGFDLVFERSEPDLTSVSATGLLMTMQTHKLLYGGGCEDITNEVMARLDKEGSKVKNRK